MADNEDSSLTGVWHGLYTYPTAPHMPESHYVCVLIDNGGRLSGTIHEAMNHYRGPATQENAIVDGAYADSHVTFLKTYDGSGAASHSVAYRGELSADRDEIEGDWSVYGQNGVFSGRFLMIRKRGQDAAATLEAFEDIRS